MFVAVGGILADSWSNKTETYRDLIDKIQEQNTKIDLLTSEIRKQKAIPLRP